MCFFLKKVIIWIKWCCSNGLFCYNREKTWLVRKWVPTCATGYLVE
ncbi:hypothetical protein HMPREF0372_03594 [Flavonifractor plautii ATCC 29863]|uniref:Uncharacterized protein n=1 Tax=Flavonifractor plautii ATCC 29863 TaxID=411475 RepID=G9YVM9_FLAPL|nr:hypothetical protein HMPREF0372_03594 [Flavonifractor plautii ATCC 29863]